MSVSDPQGLSLPRTVPHRDCPHDRTVPASAALERLTKSRDPRFADYASAMSAAPTCTKRCCTSPVA